MCADMRTVVQYKRASVLRDRASVQQEVARQEHVAVYSLPRHRSECAQDRSGLSAVTHPAWNGKTTVASNAADPDLCLTDPTADPDPGPDPNPAIFISDQDGN